MTERSLSVEEALEDALADDGKDGEDAGPLLGLEPPATENTGQNPVIDKDSNLSAMSDPLLGTIIPSSHTTTGHSRSD